MGLLVPAGLALGLTIPVVVAFYLLKVRRHDEEVSSTFLWTDLIRDLAAHEPLQRLKWNVLLAMQIIALALFATALARPAMERPAEPPVHSVLVLDGSASMQATDVAPSRFQQAVNRARETLAQLPPDSVVTLILAAAQPQVLVASTGDRRVVERALTDARPSSAAGDMRQALLLARSVGGDPASRRISIFTDGAFSLGTDVPDDLGALELVQVADADSGNLAITTISTRPDPRDTRRQQVFARVANFGNAPAIARLAVSADGAVINEQPLMLAPNSTAEHVVEDVPEGARTASLSLNGESTANLFSLDDNAFAILAQRKPAQVLLVSDGNPFLEKVLSLLPQAELYRIAARRYLAVEADRFDVVVFDDYLPPILPRGNLLIVNPPERGPLRTSGEVRPGRVAGWERDDPVLAYVDLRDLGVNRARKLELPGTFRPLIVSAAGVPLLAVGNEGERRLAIIPFDLRQSNLPLSSAFPILMSNLLIYLSPPGVVQTPSIQTGEVETLAALPQVERVRVTRPDAAVVELNTQTGPIAYAGTELPGVYRVEQLVAGGGQTIEDGLFAVNLSDAVESDVRPRLHDLATAIPDVGQFVMARQEWWTALAAVVLPLLLIEWLWFHRRV